MTRFLAFAILALLAAAPAYSQTPALTFTLSTTTNAARNAVIPTLTWSTTAGATSCTASGDWTGTQAVSGTVVLAEVSTSKTYSLVCAWPGVTRAVLNWTLPTQNTDGSALTDLAGFRIQYGRTATEAGLTESVYLQTPTVTTWTSPVLASGAWHFGIRSFNTLGLEGGLSNIASKTLSAGATDTRSLNLGIRIPNPPSGVN